MWSFIVALSWMVLHVLLVSCTEGQRIDSPSKSCLDHLKSGATKNGYYSIIDQSGSSLTVYCDFESEPGSAWTLVISWSLENNNLPAFRSTSLTDDAPVNEKTPNWIVYRQSKKAMDLIKSQSSHWRATCSFNKVKIDYRDYVRGKVADFDITTYLGNGQCKTIEYVNIRGHVGYRTTVGFFQRRSVSMLHIDSPHGGCQYNAANGALPSEDNFGVYSPFNKNFRCSSDASATTQYWFGGYA